MVVTGSVTAAQPNHAASVRPVHSQPRCQASAEPADASRIRKNTAPRVSTDRERRGDDRRQAWCVNRIDPAVASETLDVRLQLGVVVGAVVRASMHVFDREIAVEQQALRDHQVVRLVAGRDQRGDAPCGQPEDRTREDGGRHARPRRGRERRRHAAPRRQRGDHQQQDTGPDDERQRPDPEQERWRHAERQPGQRDERQQREWDQRGAGACERQHGCGCVSPG